MNYQVISLSEPTAAFRRIYFYMVDAIDGFTPETGLVFVAADILISEAGGAEASSAGTVTELAGGLYYYEATVGEVDTLGASTFRFTKAGVARPWIAFVQVVAYNPNNPSSLGLANLDAAVSSRASGTDYTALRAANLDNLDAMVSSRATPAQILVTPANLILTDAGGRVTMIPTQEDAIVDKTWDELQAGHVTAGSFGKRLDADVSTRAVPGSAMTLTTAERDAVANALLNLAGAIESTFTVKQTLQLIAAILLGKTSSGPTNTIFRNMTDTTNRVVTIADGNGNRTTVTLIP